MMKRAIQTVLVTHRVIDDRGMRLHRTLPTAGRETIRPFVFVDHYRSQTMRGIGNKSYFHAGIKIISYLLEGGMEHRDSIQLPKRLGSGNRKSSSGGIHREGYPKDLGARFRRPSEAALFGSPPDTLVLSLEWNEDAVARHRADR